jgi:hypothetical protein
LCGRLMGKALFGGKFFFLAISEEVFSRCCPSRVF